MDIHSTKIYRPTTKSMLLRMLGAIVVIAAISCIIPYKSLPGLIVVPVIILIFCLVKMLTEGTEVVAVASTKVEQGKFFGKQIILIRSIQYIRADSHFGLKYIVIETDKESFRMGGFLSAHQKKEVVANIMEHIRINIPENFVFVKRKVDKF
jgi:uncharacterized membrane protein YhhN